MEDQTAHTKSGAAWRLARRQHDLVARRQLLAIGFSPKAIKHRVATGRLHPKFRGVYAVGSPHISQRGWWMAAVLRCGPDAFLSHLSAAELLEIVLGQGGLIHVSVPRGACPRCSSIHIHRRSDLTADDLTLIEGIPVTTPARTLLDLATLIGPAELEAGVNAADKRDLIDPEALRRYVAMKDGFPGVHLLRRVLDRRTFRLTDSELERRFLRLVRGAGLSTPETGRWLHGYRVDFHWPELGLVVETDGLRYHRTAAQQACDRLRDQSLAVAGLTPLRFTHAQVRFEPAGVIDTLRVVAGRLRGRG